MALRHRTGKIPEINNCNQCVEELPNGMRGMWARSDGRFRFAATGDPPPEYILDQLVRDVINNESARRTLMAGTGLPVDYSHNRFGLSGVLRPNA
jgi:hypothetical protein